MLITKTSMLSGNTSSMDIDVSQDQIDLWQGGSLIQIQDAMPNLSADEREFIMTGIRSLNYSLKVRLSDVGHN